MRALPVRSYDECACGKLVCGTGEYARHARENTKRKAALPLSKSSTALWALYCSELAVSEPLRLFLTQQLSRNWSVTKASFTLTVPYVAVRGRCGQISKRQSFFSCQVGD